MKIDLDFIRNYGLSLNDDRDLLRKLGSICSSLTKAQQGLNTRLLDVGCGHDTEWAGKDNVATPYQREFEPWLSRIAVWDGATTTGIDYAKKSPRVDLGANGGSWHYLSHDLMSDDQWPLPQGSFEVVVINGLVHLENVEHASPRFNPALPPNTSCEENITWMERVAQYERVRRKILENILRVIQPKGRLIFNHHSFSVASNNGENSTLIPEGKHTEDLAMLFPEVCLYPFEAGSVSDQLRVIRRYAGEFDQAKRPRR